MSFIELRHKNLVARVSQQGGSLVDVWFYDRPVLRPYVSAADQPFNILDAACFPFVPFCGRIEGNEFSVSGQRYTLLPNTNMDKHCLHGDGWLSHWSMLETEAERVCLGLSHPQDSESPYHYDAQLVVSVAGEQLSMVLSVVNRGKTMLPFGLGFHPFFPLTASTKLQFQAEGYRDERDDHLPGELRAIPEELNFADARAVSDYSFHLGYENWLGYALISNPELGIDVAMQAGTECNRLQLYTPGMAANRLDALPYVCVEPMTHTCNAHRLTGEHGLQRLDCDQSMHTRMTLTPKLS